MSEWWETLGINRDVDERAVKRAYAKQLKTIDQVNEPFKFIELREALETALRDISAAAPPKPSPISVTPWAHTANDCSNNQEATADGSVSSSAEHVLADAISLLKMPQGSVKKHQWSAVLNDELLDSIDDSTEFEKLFISHLLEQTNYAENRYLTETFQCLRAYTHPVLRPPLSSHVFKEMGWFNNHTNHPYPDALDWLGFQFGAYVEKSTDHYWYRDKQELERTTKFIEIEENTTHPALMIFYFVAILTVVTYAVIFMAKVVRLV